MTQATRLFGHILLLASASCAGNTSRSTPLISMDPVSAVQQFMSAVERNDLTAMSSLWGTSDGLAADRMPSRELEQRLTVMQRYLAHEQFEVLEAGASQTLGSKPGEHYLRVRLTRNNCHPVVPITLAPLRNGWIVQSIDLTQAGNPQRNC